jgi:hypothetical protein
VQQCRFPAADDEGDEDDADETETEKPATGA